MRLRGLFISSHLRFWYRDGKTPYILRIAGIKILPGKIKRETGAER